MASPEHSEKLNEGATAWNTWREANPEIAPDLSMVNLSLNRRQFGPSNGGPINFSHTNLEATMLRFATLTGANLESACFAGSDLMHARLERTNLTSADLRGALLDNSDFTGSVLDSALLFGASLLNVRNLLQHQIDQAYGDETTLLPEGLVAPQHWLATEEPELLENEVEEVADESALTQVQPETVTTVKEPHPEPAIQSEAREVRDAIEKVLAELKSEEVNEISESAETISVSAPTVSTPNLAILTLSNLETYSPPPIPLEIKPQVVPGKADTGAALETEAKPTAQVAEIKSGSENSEVVSAVVADVPILAVEPVALEEKPRSNPIQHVEAKHETTSVINVDVPKTGPSQYTPRVISLNDEIEPVLDAPTAPQPEVSRYSPQMISMDGETKSQSEQITEGSRVAEMVFRPEKYGTLTIPKDEPDVSDTSDIDLTPLSDFLKEYVPQKPLPLEEPKLLSEETYYEYLSEDYKSPSISQPELAAYSPPRPSSKYDEPKPPFEIGNVYYEPTPKKRNNHLGIVAIFAALLISGGAYYWLGTEENEPKQAATVGENAGEKTPSTPVVSGPPSSTNTPETPSTLPTAVAGTPVSQPESASKVETTAPTPNTQPEQPVVTAEQHVPPVAEVPKENVAALDPPSAPAIEQTTQNAQNATALPAVERPELPVEHPQPVVERPIVEQSQTAVNPPPATEPQTQVAAAHNRPAAAEMSPPSERPAAASPRAKAAEKEWKRVSHSKNLTALYRFLKKYPNEPISDEARTTFGSVVSETNASKLEKFVKKNASKDNEEIAIIKQRLAEIKPEAATPPAKPNAQTQTPDEASNPDDAAWSKATTKNTRAAYDAYLRAHSEGAHAAEAKAKIGGLRDSYRQTDAAAWEKARKADSAEAYAAYLASNPRGYHVKDAKRAMNDAREEEPRPSRAHHESRSHKPREARQQREDRERPEQPRRSRTRQPSSDQAPENPEPID
jgi:hypothetical protein